MEMQDAVLIQRGREALIAALGTPEGQDSVDLFVQHHLDELDPAWWQAQLGTGVPDARSMLGLLEREMLSDDGTGFQVDYCLPDDISDYRLVVAFDRNGAVTGIAMES